MKDIKILELLDKWQKYLKIQKNCSDNTITSYKNDIENFLNFINYYNSEVVTISSIEGVDMRLMRSWLSKRQKDNYTAASNSRALSSVKNFYKFIEKTTNINCHIVFLVKTPKKAKILPKSLSQEDTNLSIKHINEFGNQTWIALRNKALLVLLYAAGLRISEALLCKS